MIDHRAAQLANFKTELKALLDRYDVNVVANKDGSGVNFYTGFGGGFTLSSFGAYTNIEQKKVIPIKQETAEIEPHTCPYKTEIHADYELCNCSEEQEHECAMDI